MSPEFAALRARAKQSMRGRDSALRPQQQPPRYQVERKSESSAGHRPARTQNPERVRRLYVSLCFESPREALDALLAGHSAGTCSRRARPRSCRRDPVHDQAACTAPAGTVEEVVAGMDTGSKTIGTAAIAGGKVVYQAEAALRDDVIGQDEATGPVPAQSPIQEDTLPRGEILQPGVHAAPMAGSPPRSGCQGREPSARAGLRRADPARPALEGRAGSLRYPQDHQSRRRRRRLFRRAQQKGYYNVKAYVMHRDGYKCQGGQKGKHSPQTPRPPQGVLVAEVAPTIRPTWSRSARRATTTCTPGKFTLKAKRSKTKHATEVGIVKRAIMRSGWVVSPGRSATRRSGSESSASVGPRATPPTRWRSAAKSARSSTPMHLQ